MWSVLGCCCFPWVLGSCWNVLREPHPLARTWPQLGHHFGAKIQQKSVQEPSKIHLNLYLVFDILLNQCLMDFGSKSDPKITPKSIPKSIQELPKKLTTKEPKKCNYFVLAGPMVSCLRPCEVEYENHEKSM